LPAPTLARRSFTCGDVILAKHRSLLHGETWEPASQIRDFSSIRRSHFGRMKALGLSLLVLAAKNLTVDFASTSITWSLSQMLW
jgi:hypothetical protein